MSLSRFKMDNLLEKQEAKKEVEEKIEEDTEDEEETPQSEIKGRNYKKKKKK